MKKIIVIVLLCLLSFSIFADNRGIIKSIVKKPVKTANK